MLLGCRTYFAIWFIEHGIIPSLRILYRTHWQKLFTFWSFLKPLVMPKLRFSIPLKRSNLLHVLHTLFKYAVNSLFYSVSFFEDFLWSEDKNFKKSFCRIYNFSETVSKKCCSFSISLLWKLLCWALRRTLNCVVWLWNFYCPVF